MTKKLPVFNIKTVAGALFQSDANGRLNLSEDQCEEVAFSILQRSIGLLAMMDGKVEIELSNGVGMLTITHKANGADKTEHEKALAYARELEIELLKVMNNEMKIGKLSVMHIGRLIEFIRNGKTTDVELKAERP